MGAGKRLRLGLGAGFGNGTTEKLLQLVEASGSGGAEIDLDDGALGNGVDGDSAFDAADVEGGSGIDGQRNAEESGDEKGGGNDGIGRAEIAPGMAARTGDDELKTAAAKSLGDDVVRAGTVEGDERGKRGRGDIFGGGRQMPAVEMAHAAQIAFALFTDIGDKEHGHGGLNADLMEGGSQGPESGKSGAVVTDAGTEKLGVLAANVERRGGGEDGIEMSAESDGRRVGLESGARGEKVANGVSGGGEAAGPEARGEPGGAGLLGKGRRGNGGDGKLEIGDVALVTGKTLEEAVDARVGGETIDLLREGAGLNALGLRPKPGEKRHERSYGTRGEVVFGFL
jgi:hypothetical protein